MFIKKEKLSHKYPTIWVNNLKENKRFCLARSIGLAWYGGKQLSLNLKSSKLYFVFKVNFLTSFLSFKQLEVHYSHF